MEDELGRENVVEEIFSSSNIYLRILELLAEELTATMEIEERVAIWKVLASSADVFVLFNFCRFSASVRALETASTFRSSSISFHGSTKNSGQKCLPSFASSSWFLRAARSDFETIEFLFICVGVCSSFLSLVARRGCSVYRSELAA